MTTLTSRYSRITGTGSHLPPRRLSNDDMTRLLAERGLDTSDAWIVERTGIRARHFADEGVNASDLALHAARAALESAGRTPDDIDLIIVATSTPDMVFPSTACILQHKLGIAGCAAFDVQAVCSGFVYALSVADGFVARGNAKCALVIGAEAMTRLMDWSDRGTCVLFGDGAGAVVLDCAIGETSIDGLAEAMVGRRVQLGRSADTAATSTPPGAVLMAAEISSVVLAASRVKSSPMPPAAVGRLNAGTWLPPPMT